MALVVTPASEQDRAQVGKLAKQVREVTDRSVELAYVDQSYTGESATTQAEAESIQLEVLKYREAKRGFVLLPSCWVVERTFARLARFRRLAGDYERLSTTLNGWHWPPSSPFFCQGCSPKVHNRL